MILSDEMYKQLQTMIRLPDHCIALNLSLKHRDPVHLTTVTYAVDKDGEFLIKEDEIVVVSKDYLLVEAGSPAICSECGVKYVYPTFRPINDSK